MTIKEYIIADAVQSFDNFMVTARKVPADKLDWKPLDNGRSTLDDIGAAALGDLDGGGVESGLRADLHLQAVVLVTTSQKEAARGDAAAGLC